MRNISMCLPRRYCFLTELWLLEELRREQLSSDESSCPHRSCVHKPSGDLSFPFSVTNVATNCSSPMYWNKRVTFSTSGTVRMGQPHANNFFSPCILYLYAIFWLSCWSPRNWAKTQEPRHPGSHLHLWSDPTPLFHIRPVPHPGPPFCTLYIL